MSETDDLRASLEPPRRWGRWVFAALIVLVVAGIAIQRARSDEESGPRWKTAEVSRGDILLKATATGTLEPRRTVTVGAEVSGQLVEVLADANEHVEKGQVLARLDTSTVENELAQARAALAGAHASLKRSRASLEEAKLYETRVSSLLERKGIASSEKDAAEARRLRAEADVQASQAEIRRASASIKTIESRKEKATITAPIDGVVLKRAVEPGNTVASSLQTPELFVIAEDLAKMELQVLINEADVGLVEPGQQASFFVDTWPERTFEATVETVSLSPTPVGDVVTYMTMLTVRNDEGLLRPGMTASVTIQTGKREGVLRVPARALWFKPPAPDEGGFSFGRRRRRDSAREKGSAVHVLEDSRPRRVVLEIGRSDGEFVEVRGGPLEEGDVVLVGRHKKKDESSELEEGSESEEGS